MGSSGIEISYDAPQAVRVALARIGRTEDVAFSPNNRRLALAAFDHNSIAIADIDITTGNQHLQVRVTDVAEYSSPCLNSPHGVDFLDDETIIVANRDANVAAFRLPSAHSERTALAPFPNFECEQLGEPSALTIVGNGDRTSDVLVCNNSSNTVTRHVLQNDPLSVTSSDVLLHRWLALPDGVAVSEDGRWLAISNHDAHTVMLYQRLPSLDEDSDPDGILLGASFPHGVRFADARHLLVSDGGKPCLHVYVLDDQSWRGVQYPAASLRVMDDEVFRLGRDRESGGPKGIDIDRRGQVLAMTFENHPLAFFDVSAILARSTGQCPDHALRVNYELEILEQARVAKARIAALEGSTSFRITRPLRRLSGVWSRRRR